ncbi:unnamed protein product [Adineta ricciae]|uniref:BTB domain-containing protein n=1 Tax=Adineta ricciae TaxID=249248 RepID=A0A815V7D8_ADIRI|nr:unnamed protein product [Adineta ricciae]CAF1526349.1 unnamed protein product [Adineta ricciae]
MDSSTPELLRLSSQLLSPFEYFTDSSDTINTKTDVVLVVGKERFYCHSLLLSMVSPVFSRMFDGQFKEHSEREIVLEGKSSEAILELLKCIYPQFNGQITDENVEHFLLLADEYMIEHLKQPCKELLMNQLRQLKYISLPTKENIVQASSKSRSTNTSDSAMNLQENNDGHSSGHENSSRLQAPRRPVASPRHTPNKPSSLSSRHGDRAGSASNTTPRYFLSLDRTQIPTFYNESKAKVPFTVNEVNAWLRRLRILYQIDKGRNYSEVMDSILSILQFIPTSILLPFVQPTTDTYSALEIMLNDISRARMCLLEDWASDGNFNRPVALSESYRTMFLSATAPVEQAATVSTKPVENEETAFQSVITITSDPEELISPSDTDTE